MRGFPAAIPKIKDIALLSEGRNIISTDRKSCFGRQLVPATGMINVVTEMAINRHLPPIAKKTRRGAEHFRSIADKCRSGNCLPPSGNCLPPLSAAIRQTSAAVRKSSAAVRQPTARVRLIFAAFRAETPTMGRGTDARQNLCASAQKQGNSVCNIDNSGIFKG
jgi:hypothetical protein